jgi:hypothetical protein
MRNFHFCIDGNNFGIQATCSRFPMLYSNFINTQNWVISEAAFCEGSGKHRSVIFVSMYIPYEHISI